MRKNKIQKAVAAMLSAVMLLGMASTAYAQNNGKDTSTSAVSSADADYTKNENVYARLSTDGTPNGAYIVNHFHVKKAGQITDYGKFSNVTNLSTTDNLNAKNGSINFSAPIGNFYYQGDMTKAELPWEFNITYTLNGESIKPNELGGKSGELRIQFKSKKNSKANAVFSDNYVMQVSLTLDNDICDNIQAPDATIADAGNGTQLTFTVLPGSDADFSIETYVKDFSMSGFSIAAVPYSISVDTDSFNTDDLTSRFSELTDAAKQLNSGAEELLNGILKLNDGGDSVTDGSAQIKSGLLELNNSSQPIVEASSKFNSALSAISTQLAQADFSGLSELAKLPDGLNQLSTALNQVSQGLSELKEGFDTAFQAMDGAVQNEAVSAPTQEELAAVRSACAVDSNALSGYQKLMQAYKQYQTLVAVWNNVKPAFQAVSSVLDTQSEKSVLRGIDTVSSTLKIMSDSISDSMGSADIETMFKQLSSGLAELSSGYSDFHSGLCSYTKGIEKLSDNYGKFHGGVQDYTNGTVSLAKGAGKFTDGMNEFTDGVSQIPSKVQDSIDEMMEQYNSSDFDAVSFTDSRNENISSVQFVISTDGIELPETQPASAEEEHLTFWDRLLALFGLR